MDNFLPLHNWLPDQCVIDMLINQFSINKWYRTKSWKHGIAKVGRNWCNHGNWKLAIDNKNNKVLSIALPGFKNINHRYNFRLSSTNILTNFGPVNGCITRFDMGNHNTFESSDHYHTLIKTEYGNDHVSNNWIKLQQEYQLLLTYHCVNSKITIGCLDLTTNKLLFSFSETILKNKGITLDIREPKPVSSSDLLLLYGSELLS